LHLTADQLKIFLLKIFLLKIITKSQIRKLHY
jgi:hypothetical protein